MKVQYFSFFENRIDVSEVCSILEDDLCDEWDYALVKDRNKVTGYKSSYSGWRRLSIGENPWGLKFMQPGIKSYKDHSEYKHLAH